jgi:hypothetical protein
MRGKLRTGNGAAFYDKRLCGEIGMERERMEELCGFFHRDLVKNTIQFWKNCSVDAEHGGFLSLIDRDGSLLTLQNTGLSSSSATASTGTGGCSSS